MHGLQYELTLPFLRTVKLDIWSSRLHFGQSLQSESIMRSNQTPLRFSADDNTRSERHNALSRASRVQGCTPIEPRSKPRIL
jgi:hypothetical protein